MAKALAHGDGCDRIRREIARRFVGQSVSNIMRVVQTEGTYVSRRVQGEEMRRAGFDSYHIDSVDDSRTCGTCKAISRRSHEEPFRFEDARPGENYPPLHPRCRCEVNPAVDSWADWIRGGTGRPQDRERAAERFGADVLRTLADPAADYYGSAEKDDSKRLTEIIEDLKSSGIKIIRHGRAFEGIGYSPCSAGTPGTGQMHVTEGMSLLAWEHEYDHFLWDMEHGCPGIKTSMYDISYRTEAEKRAYSREIEIASRRGDNDLVEKLESLLSAELKRLGEVIQHVAW